MGNKISLVKITICAAFVSLFVAAMFFSQTSKTAAIQTAENNLETPQNCAACHQENHASWQRNNHSKTVRKATNETVQGDFVNVNSFENAGVKAEMKRDNENFYIKIGEQNHKVAAIVGVKYIEQYIAEKDGEFYSLPIAYNLEEKRWINLNEANFEKKNLQHLKNWKTDCAACHRSGENDFQKGFEDFGISCNSCHGNSAKHLESKTFLWAKIGFKTENKIVNPRDLSSDASMMSCAGCHARDLNETPKFEKAQSSDLVSAHKNNDDDSARYWADGSNKYSGNEYQAIIRSVCYAQSKAGGHGISGEKISCASCHSQHEPDGKNIVPEKSYNQNCVQCHSQFSDESAIAEHTKHPLDSTASNCASCHQPETVFSHARFTQTHEISVPNPSLTIEKQVPNACNLCHTDESVNWAIRSSKKLWSERFRDAEISPDKQFDQPESLRALSSNDAFLRTLAADSLRKHSNFKWSAPFLFEVSRTEEFPFVNYLLINALKTENTNFQKDFKKETKISRTQSQPK